MKRFFSKSWLRILSGLFTNLAATALAVMIILPNFLSDNSSAKSWLLTYNAVMATIFLLLAVRLDELL